MCGAATTRKDRTAVVVKRLAVENDFGCIAGGIAEVLRRNAAEICTGELIYFVRIGTCYLGYIEVWEGDVRAQGDL